MLNILEFIAAYNDYIILNFNKLRIKVIKIVRKKYRNDEKANQ
jgi:hypothetical protein